MRQVPCERGQNYNSWQPGSSFSAEEEGQDGQINKVQRDNSKKGKEALGGQTFATKQRNKNDKDSCNDRCRKNLTTKAD